MPIYEEECSKCHYVNEYLSEIVTTANRPCPKCGAETERLFSLYKPKVFNSFTTRNILPDGIPITVKGSGQLRQLEAEHGVKMVDDPKAESPKTLF